MALLRKLFFRKPPEGLLEICERVYVFDCCFTIDAGKEEDYKVYIGGILSHFREHLPDASILVFNFGEDDMKSAMAKILSVYDINIMDYPRHYEGCPLLKMEVIHHFSRSNESWLSQGQNNLLLMHCEQGSWPVLSFMLAALLIYHKQYSEEQRTLDMVYKKALHELLHLLSPLNPIPSQLRYLQYISRRNIAVDWSPTDQALSHWTPSFSDLSQILMGRVVVAQYFEYMDRIHVKLLIREPKFCTERQEEAKLSDHTNRVGLRMHTLQNQVSRDYFKKTY